MPSGLIEHDDGMGTGFNDAGDLGEVSVQCFRVGIGHNEASSFALAGADEDISRRRPLVLGC